MSGGVGPLPGLAEAVVVAVLGGGVFFCLGQVLSGGLGGDVADAAPVIVAVMLAIALRVGFLNEFGVGIPAVVVGATGGVGGYIARFRQPSSDLFMLFVF